MLDVPVQACRREEQGNPLLHSTPRGDVESRRLVKSVIPCFLEKPRREIHLVTVPQTDTGRRAEHAKALERTLVKELGKLTP